MNDAWGRRVCRRRRRLGWFGSLAGVALLAVAAGCAAPTAAPGAGDGGVSAGAAETVVVNASGPIDVVLSDSGPSGPMSLVPFDSSAPAGNVTFRVKNLEPWSTR